VNVPDLYSVRISICSILSISETAPTRPLPCPEVACMPERQTPRGVGGFAPSISPVAVNYSRFTVDAVVNSKRSLWIGGPVCSLRADALAIVRHPRLVRDSLSPGPISPDAPPQFPAIMNAANESRAPGGWICSPVGRELAVTCRAIGRTKTGEGRDSGARASSVGLCHSSGKGDCAQVPNKINSLDF
jgi:hypothetical protein